MPDFDIRSKQNDLINYSELWNKKSLSKINKTDQKLILKAYKILNDPKSKDKLTETEYKNLLTTLNKLPPKSESKSLNIFRKIHLPWSKESQIRKHMKKAEKTYQKEEKEKLYSGLNKQVLNEYFDSNKIHPKEQVELIKLTNLIIPNRKLIENELIALLDFIRDHGDNESIMEYTKIILSDNKAKPSEVIPDIEKYFVEEKPQVQKVILEFFNDYEDITGKDSKEKIAFLPAVRVFTQNLLYHPETRSAVADFTRDIIKNKSLNAEKRIPLLRQIEILYRRTNKTDWEHVKSFIEDNAKNIPYAGLLLDALLDDAVGIIGLIESFKEPMPSSEIENMAIGLSIIPKENRIAFRDFIDILMFFDGLNIDKAGTVLFNLRRISRETLELLSSEHRKIFLPDLDNLDSPIALGMFKYDCQRLATIPRGKEKEAFDYAISNGDPKYLDFYGMGLQDHTSTFESLFKKSFFFETILRHCSPYLTNKETIDFLHFASKMPRELLDDEEVRNNVLFKIHFVRDKEHFFKNAPIHDKEKLLAFWDKTRKNGVAYRTR